MPSQPWPETADFVIVGSGAGGGPLAARLAMAGHTVVVLEAGDDHECPYYSVPIMQAYASEDADMSWDFFVRHWDDDVQQRKDSKFVTSHDGVLYPRGSTIGGSTAVSAMVTMRPHDRDWDDLAKKLGDPSWAAGPMHELFKSMESWHGVDPEPLPGDDAAERDRKADHGRGGWLGTTRADPRIAGREPMFLDIIGAVETVARERFGIDDAISLPRDINARDTPDDFEGMSYIPVAVRDGHRNGTRELLASTVAQRPDNLYIVTNALATRIVIENGVAVGVEYVDAHGSYAANRLRHRGDGDSAAPEVRTVHATKEVVVAAGAFNTPQLLMLSGIGPKDHLADHGVDVVVDAPGVGRNLHDRYEVSVVAQLDRDYSIFEGSALDIPGVGDEDADPLFREWRENAGGPFSTNGSLAALVGRSQHAREAGLPSDLVVFALPIQFSGYYPGYAPETVEHHDRVSVVVLKGHTTNRAGTVTLRSDDPTSPPDIRFAYFEEGDGDAAADLAGTVEGVEIARDIIAALQTPVLDELIPGAAVRDRPDLERFVRNEAWGHHACGTARMGTDDDPGAVVDSRLRVRGVSGLRVADASVFPDIPGFFIATAVYLVGEKAGQDLVSEYGPGGHAAR